MDLTTVVPEVAEIRSTLDLPPGLIYAIGALVLLNLGTIGSIVVFAGRTLWWISKLDSRVEKNTEDNNEAHKKIRELNEIVKTKSN